MFVAPPIGMLLAAQQHKHGLFSIEGTLGMMAFHTNRAIIMRRTKRSHDLIKDAARAELIRLQQDDEAQRNASIQSGLCYTQNSVVTFQYGQNNAQPYYQNHIINACNPMDRHANSDDFQSPIPKFFI